MGFRHNYRKRGVLGDPDNLRIQTILEIRDMVLIIAGTKSKCEKHLSKNTAVSIHRTCDGLVELCRHLTTTSHHYVYLSKFSTDFLKKNLCELCQSSGVRYFISVQQVIENVHIKNYHCSYH